MCKGCGCDCSKANCKGKCGTGKFSKVAKTVKKAVKKVTNKK